jgi:BirA family biotin operon repressor/biotin-[acetyl-CoA-carboxylase] ligase
MVHDDLAAGVEALPAPWQGRFFESVDSTQDEARAAARAGAPDRAIFVANYQRGGRGRSGRRWIAAPGSALLVSIVFRESSTSPMPWRWTALASVALVDTIQAALPTAAAEIKWPNDVMLGERKVAGVLAEVAWSGADATAIVGVGLNVNVPAADLRCLPNATSLHVGAGRPLERRALLLDFVRRIDGWSMRPPDEIFEAWQGRLWRRGQRLRLLDVGTDEEEVLVLGADRDGALRVRAADGTERRTTTGELLP